MKIGYIECFAGISGDMLLGALLDAGVPQATLEEAAAGLGIGATLRISRVNRSGIQAAKVDVMVDGHSAEEAAHSDKPNASEEHSHGPDHEHPHTHPEHVNHAAHAQEKIPMLATHSHADGHEHTHEPDQQHDHEHHDDPHDNVAPEHAHSHTHGRNLPEILGLIADANIPPAAGQLATEAFQLLAAAEARIHGVPPEKIHFHEVGAVDAIVDIVCSAVGLTALGVQRWVASPLNVGGGFIDCAHGHFPVPAPATAELLKGAPTYSSGIQMELVTPTGAALLRALGCSFGDQPAMRTEAIGYGAGNRNPEKFPNVVRISIGKSKDEVPLMRESVAVLECAIDDQSPQVLAHFMQLALERGALDVLSTPVTMKKGRLGTLLTLLVPPERGAEFGELLLRETSTLGYRIRNEERACLNRAWTEVETAYGKVRVKIGSSAGIEYNYAPEYEDCRLLATEHGVPVKLVLQAAVAAATTERTTAHEKAI